MGHLRNDILTQVNCVLASANHDMFGKKKLEKNICSNTSGKLKANILYLILHVKLFI